MKRLYSTIVWALVAIALIPARAGAVTDPVVTCTDDQLPLDKQVFAEVSEGPAPLATNIIVNQYQDGVMYTLRNDADNSVVAGPQPGSWAFYVQGITQTTVYNVLATNPQTGCQRQLSTKPVVTITGTNPPPPPPPPPTEGKILYPDLFSWAKAGTYMYDVVIDNTAGRLLRFSVAIANKGVGPFELHAIVESDGTTIATQWIYDDQGGHIEKSAGTFVFSDHAGHNHFHFANFANYRLRSVIGNNGIGQVIATSDKISFAMFDVAVYNTSLPGAPASRVYLRPELTSLDPEGISVGWADVYGRTLGDQWIDIAGVPDGQYWLEVTVDPNQLLDESDETNNVTYAKVILKGNKARTNNDRPNFALTASARTTSLSEDPGLVSSPEPIATTETEDGTENFGISAYPNPTNGVFDIVINDDTTGVYQVLVRDFAGATVAEQTIIKEGNRSATTRLELNAREGMYVLSISGNGMTTNRKLVIRK
jgi:hypothetical protein